MSDNERLPTPKDLMQNLPVSSSQRDFIDNARVTIRNILNGKDPRMLIVVGPCSIHDITAAKEYATKLRLLSREIAETCYVVMRAYFEKPRTSLGWKGILYDPYLDGSHAIGTGLQLTRRFLLDLAELEIPAASEFLDPVSPSYLGDLVSWGCIGARTAASQIHRQIASGLAMPVAFKNSTDGNIDIAINGVAAALSAHTFIGMDGHGHVSVIRTQGNNDAHIALRGGENRPNYDAKSVAQALNLLRKFKLPPRLVIDCSHDNSNRSHDLQASVFQEVISQVINGTTEIRGVALESHLYAGNQAHINDVNKLKYAVSITDPCLGWTETENLLHWADKMLKGHIQKTTPCEGALEDLKIAATVPK